MALCTWPGAAAQAENGCWGAMPPDLAVRLLQQHYCSSGTACMRQVNSPQVLYTVRATAEHTAPPSCCLLP